MFLFFTLTWGNDPFWLYNIFQRGWFSHQQVGSASELGQWTKVWVQSDERARLERLQQRTSAVDASLGQKMKLDFEAPGGIFLRLMASENIWLFSGIATPKMHVQIHPWTAGSRYSWRTGGNKSGVDSMFANKVQYYYTNHLNCCKVLFINSSLWLTWIPTTITKYPQPACRKGKRQRFLLYLGS